MPSETTISLLSLAGTLMSSILTEEIKVANHRIEDLKQFHK